MVVFFSYCLIELLWELELWCKVFLIVFGMLMSCLGLERFLCVVSEIKCVNCVLLFVIILLFLIFNEMNLGVVSLIMSLGVFLLWISKLFLFFSRWMGSFFFWKCFINFVNLLRLVGLVKYLVMFLMCMEVNGVRGLFL